MAFEGAADGEGFRVGNCDLRWCPRFALCGFLQFLFAPIWGRRFSDRVGSRRVLLLTLRWDMLPPWVCGSSAGSFWILVLFRVRSVESPVAPYPWLLHPLPMLPPGKIVPRGWLPWASRFGLGFVLGPHWEGLPVAWDRSDGSRCGSLRCHPFSLAAVIRFCLAVVNWAWLATAISRNFLPVEKRGQEIASSLRPALFPDWNVANSAVRNTCLSHLCYMISFSGMEFTLTFLAVETVSSMNPRDMLPACFLLIGFDFYFCSGIFLCGDLWGRIGEKNMALQGIVLGFACLAFTVVHCRPQKHGFSLLSS